MGECENKSGIEEEQQQEENYEWLMTPKNAAKDSKTGVTFRGSDAEYLNAHKVLVEMIKKKGDIYVINGIEISIADTQNNKPVSLEVKPKGGLTGKANLKVYGINKRGGATIMVTKPRLSHFTL